MLPADTKPLPKGRGFFVGGLILAGGRARRLGSVEKGLQLWRGRPLASWAADALYPHCRAILINANRHQADYRRWADGIVPDQYSDAGPLAGLHAGLVKAVSLEFTGVLVLPCDTPGVDASLMAEVARLARREPGCPAVFQVGERINPLHGYYPVRLASALANYIEAGERRVQGFVMAHEPVLIKHLEGDSRFSNLNCPQDWPGGL